MNSKKTRTPRTKGRGKFYLLVLSAIAMSALVGACACEDSPALELSYPPIVGTIHSEIGETAPAWSSNLGEEVEYKIEPALPEGLSLASDTGIISGTPKAVITQEYTITATLASGTVKETTISITIEDTSEGAFFTYEPIVGAVGGEIAPAAPQWDRNLSEEITYTIDPELPAGLTFDPAAGTISGTPGALWEVDHTVTAAYGGKEKTGVVTITVLSKNTLPGPPTALTAVTGDETAQVGWTAPVNTGLVDNAAGRISGYKVYWDEVAAPTKASSFLLIGDSAAVSAEVAGLTNGRSYYFAAAAFNQLGEGELSEAIAAPASKPGKLAVPSAVPSGQAITVSWLPPLSETVGPMEALTGYKVYYRETAAGGDELVQEVGPETTSVTIENLADGTYSFWVTAAYGQGENAGESESSDLKEILLSQTSPPDNAVPGQPWNVKAKAGNGEISITWSAPADTGIVNGQKADITSYTVYYAEGTEIGDITQGSPSSLEFPDPSAEPSLTIEALANGTAYVIAVTASNDEGEGSLSAPVTSQPREENRPPTAPAITDAVAGDGEVKLIWSPPADFGMIEGTAGSLTAYGVYFARGEAPTESSDVRMIFNVSDTSLVIDELENGTPYQFALRAYTTAGESGLSEPLEAAPKEDDRVPGAPGQLSAVFDTGEVSVSWAAPDDAGIVNGEAGKITGYNIHYSQDADDIRNGAVEEVRPTGEEVPLTWTFALADGGSYYFAVAAVTGAGAGELSSAVQTDRAPGKPSKPQALPGDGTIRVRWHAPADSGIVGGAEAEITGYKVYYREEGAVGEPAFKDAGAADREAVLDLTNGLTYFISVAAVNGAGEGEPSDEKEAEPTAGSLADRAPDEPWDVRVIEGDEALTVTWKDPADSGIFQGQEAVITKFEVYYTEGALDPDALTPEEVDLAANPDAERKVELTGLTNGTPYNVAVRTVTPAGTSPLSAVITGTPQIPDQVPGIPSITLTEAEHEKVRIRWSAPDTPGFVNGLEAAITGYRIYYARGVEPAKTSSFVEIEDGAALEGAVENLVNGRTYHFAVSAMNGAGEGELSEPKTAQPYRAANRPPGKPDAPVLIPKNTQIAVYWSLPDDGGIVDGYEGVIKKVRIYYAEGSEPAKTSPYVEVDVSDGTSEGLITNLTNMTSYSIGVTAINDEGEGELSDSTTGIPTPYHINQVPAAPTDVQVSAGDGKLTVSWKEALDTGSYNNQKGTIQNFRVYYGAGSIDGSTPAYATKVISDPPEDPWTLTIGGLTNGDTYNLAVTAFNEEGESPPSAEVQGIPLGEIQSYKVTYNSYQGNAVDAEDVTFDTLVTEPGAPSKANLNFVGWYREDTLTTPWDFDNDKMEAGDMTLHAKWEAQVTFEFENGKAAVTQRVDEGAAAAKPSDPAKTGYTFAEWYTDPQGTTPWNFADPLTGHTTLYAGWTANDYTATFVPNNGESDITEDFPYETPLTAPTPVRMGHALAGWFKQDGSSNGQWGVEWDFAADKMALGGVTLYAKWDIQSYQVTFESHGGSGVAAQTITYDSLVTAPTSDPTRGGYTFAGWYGEDGENNGGNWGTPWDFTQDKVAAQAMTLYARWYSPPSAPGNMVVSSYDDDSVTLSWDASNNPGSSGGADATITDYMVYYSTTAPVNTSSASSVSSIAATGVTVSGLINNTPYNFVVLAVNSVGLESAPSNEVTQTTDLSDAEKAAADKGDLDIRSAAGGDLQAVKADFTLPVTGGRGTAISWAVISGTAIALGGTNGENADVTRPTALGSDDIVVLRASITLGSASETKDFTLTVKKQENLTDQETVDQDTNALTVDSFQFAQGDTYTQITQDFTLPITGGEGSEISWTLTSGSAVSLSGTRNGTAAVTRPDYLDGSAAVELEATITKGSVSDTKSFSLTVYRKDRVDIASLSSADFSLTVVNKTVTVLTGGTHNAAVGGSLTAGTDYVLTITGTGVTSGAVSIDNNGTITITGGIALTDAGDYTVKAAGQGNYDGEKTASFTLGVDKIVLGTVISVSVDNKAVTVLTGETHDVTVGGGLIAGTDYDLTITGPGVTSNAVSIANGGTITITDTISLSDEGTYTVTAAGKGNYSGSVSDDFELTVTEKSLTAAGFTLSAGNTAVAALTEGTFDVTVGGGLTAGTDYSLAIAAPAGVTNHLSITNGGTITIDSAIEVTHGGTYTVTAAGENNYSGTVFDTFTLTVNRKDISSIQSFNVSASNKAATSRTGETYQGGTMGGGLEYGTDYGLAITTKAGGAANFISVDSVDSSSGVIMFVITNDIALNDAGTYTITATGMAGSNYTGSVSDDFELTVAQKSLSDLDDAVFDVSVGDKTVTALTGNSHTAAITNTGTPSLAVNTDYSLTITAPAGVTQNHLSIDDNGTITIGSAIEVTHAGTYTLTANGLGEYTGSKSDTFFLSVTEKSLTAAGLTLSAGNTAVTALTEATHTATVGGGLRAGTDYGLSITGPGAASGAVSIDNNGTITITGAISVSDAGSYTVEAAGKNNYIGTVSDSFTLTVNRKDITTIQSFSVLASDKTATSRTSETYQGGTMGGGLKYGTDYGLAITTKAGGAANFFSVDSVDSSSGAITFTITNGIALNDAGTYTLRANGMGNYTGSVSDDFVLTVNQKSLSDLDDAVFGVSVGDKTVTALTEDSHTPAITNTGSPSLVFNTDYSLTITAPAGVTPNHLSIADDGAITIDSAIEVTHGGTYTLTANGLGEYTGSKSDTFTLGVSPKSLTDAGFALSVDAIATTAGTGGSYPAVSASGFTGGTDYSLAIAAPDGVTNHLSIANDGTITIDPAIEVTHGGTYTLTAAGINNYSDTDSAAFTLTVYLPALEGITYPDTSLTLDVDIGFGIWPEGSSRNDVTYAMKPGESLPEGLILDSTWGKISGTPTEGVPRTAYTIMVTGREGTAYAGGQNEAIIMISVDNAVDTFFDFNLPAAEVDAQKNGADLGQVINITRNDRNFIEDTEYRWAITKKSDGTAPEFMNVTNNKLWIIGADIPGSSAAGTYELTAAGHGRYSGEITKEFELKLPADSPPSGAPDITGIAPRDGALVVSWIAPADRGYYDGGKGVITGYTVYWDTASGLTASTAANSQTVLPANNSYEIASLTNGQTYYFIVTAATAMGTGPASSAASGTPNSGYTPPGAPNIVSATASNAQVEVGWTAPTDPGLVNNQPGSPSYRIYYSRTPDFGLGQAEGYREAANSARSLVVDQLTNLVKYYFRVTAYTGSGESSASTGVLSATPGAVALDANGGSGEPAEAMLQLLTGKIPDYSYGTLERSGYAFAGWNTAADGSGDTYRSGDNYSFTEVTTLYAYWLEATEELEYTLIKNDTEYSVKYGEVDQAGADAVSSVIIPAYWQEKPVTEIGDNAFYRPSIVFNNLDSVTMAEGLTKIGASAFREAPLEDVTSLPSSVAEIGDYAFQKSKIALDIFYYQEHSSYKIGANSFEDVRTLTATTLPSDFEISEYAFRNTLLHFNSLPNVVYKGHGGFENAQFSNPDIVTSIKKYSLFSTFKESNITSIDITMKTLFANFTDTFRDCASLKTVTLRFDDNTPGSPAIPTYSDALLGCPSLEAIYVPSSYVNGYKTADGWSSFASIIKAIPGS